MNLCDYGCGKESKYIKANGKKCCSSHHTQCSSWKSNQEALFIEKYGVKNPAQASEVKEKTKKTNIDRYGVENPNQNLAVISKRLHTNNERYGGNAPLSSESIRAKQVQTLVTKHGVDNPAKTPNGISGFNAYVNDQCRLAESVTKIKKTKLERYGNESYNNPNKQQNTVLEKYGVDNVSQIGEVKDKKKKTMLKNYGVDNPSQSNIIKERMSNTNLSRYGVENPSQNSEISQKTLESSFRKKKYVFPSGRIETIQGNEAIALDRLLFEEGVLEDDIIVNRTKVPELWWNDNGVRRRYYVDIYVTSQNRLIEVKSSWTNRDDEEVQRVIKCKMESATNAGFNIEIYEV